MVVRIWPTCCWPRKFAAQGTRCPNYAWRRARAADPSDSDREHYFSQRLEEWPEFFWPFGPCRCCSSLVPDNLPLDHSLTVDWRVLGFGFGLSLAAGVLFAILPALHITRENSLASGTREGSREGVGGRKGVLRNALVVTEIAVSAMLWFVLDC